MLAVAQPDPTAFQGLIHFMGTPAFNSLVLAVGVVVAIFQLRSAKAAIKQQIQAVREQIATNQRLSADQLLESRRIAKRSETAKLLMHCRGDERLQRGVSVVQKYYRSTGHNIRDLALRPTGEDEASKARAIERADVVYLLNHYENVCICIAHGIYCEEMVLDAWKTMLIVTFDESRVLITAMRERSGNPNILTAFQRTAETWGAGNRIYQEQLSS